MIELDHIYNCDCLEGMKQIPDGSVDAVICDLPYGTMKGAQLDGWEGQKNTTRMMMCMHSFMENWTTPSGNGIRVELIS